jgi:hypothetical protein
VSQSIFLLREALGLCSFPSFKSCSCTDGVGVLPCREVAPRYYSHVHIHGGWLPSGFATPAPLLESTIYLDYQADSSLVEMLRSLESEGPEGGPRLPPGVVRRRQVLRWGQGSEDEIDGTTGA